MQLNDVTRLLLQKMQEEPGLTGEEHLRRIAETIGHTDPDRVIASGAEVLDDLRERDVVLGTVRAEVQDAAVDDV